MNLTTPPPVEDLDPQYADDLRTELVRNARKSRRQRSVWVPVLAAACGVAVITGGVVAGTRSGGGPAEPVGSPSSSPAPGKVQHVPPGRSARISLDLGPASHADSLAAARRCLAQKSSAFGEPNTTVPADVDGATWQSARWQKTVPGQGGPSHPKTDKQLVQSFTTKAGVRLQCLDATLLEAFDPAVAGISWVKSRPLNVADPVNGQWLLSQAPDGRSLFAAFGFSAMPNVTRVELRIRWTGGASPWYGVVVAGGSGYASATQEGAVNQRLAREVDYRAFDRNDRVLFSGIEYG
jgi:hypothetical protein